MKTHSHSFIVLLLLAVIGFTAPADEQTSEVPDFTTVHKQWKDLDSEIDATIQAYRTATEAERDQLRKEYEGLVARSRKLLPKLRIAAIVAYSQSPNESEDVTRVLVGVAANDVRTDAYEQALEILHLLEEHKCKEPVVDTFAGIAAYCMDDYVAAEDYLNRAKANDALTSTAENYLQDLGKAKSVWTAEQTLRKAEAKADDLPRVKIETTSGVMVVELYENEAPQTVGNFVNLVEKKYYDGLTFHRVLPGFMAQGGCPDGSGSGGPGYEIYCECREKNHRKHFRGTLSMAHAGLNSGGSQFFLTFRRTAHLDGRHTVFGRVIEGLNVLAKIQRIDPERAGGPEPDKIVKAEVLRKRDHAYEPTKVQ